jgi:DNA-binding response OmpR family regulator
MKLLIIEDNIDLLNNIVEFFQKDNIVETASDFRSGLKKIYNYEYDVIIVDIGLPDGSGLDLIKKLKYDVEEVGIIIVSAKDSLDDKITGLDIGADDYITKPFDIAELNARVKSVIRRKKQRGSSNIEFGELSIEPDARTCSANGEIIDFTPKEFDLLLYLVNNKDRVISKQSIAEYICGDYLDMAYSHDFIYTHIKNLRRKLGKYGCKDYLKSVYGLGYKFSLI